MLINLLLFLFALTIIISIHELGHLIVAKFFGVYCFEYSIGMGPRIFKKRFKETTFSIRALPIGGYVSMAGESDINEEIKDEYDVDNIPYNRTLPGVAPLKRILIMSAGIIMNFILGILIVSALLLQAGSYASDRPPIIRDVMPDSPAEKAGLKAGDKIIRAQFEDGTIVNKPKTIEDVASYISYKGGKIILDVERNDETLQLEVEAYYNPETESNMIGIYLPEGEVVNITLFNVLRYATDYIYRLVRNIFITLANLLRGRGFNDISGPIGMYEATSEAASYGIGTYFNLIAMFSINVGILNALPIPALDGGRIFLTLVEMIIHRPIDKKLETALIGITMALLLLLMLVVLAKDLINLI